MIEIGFVIIMIVTKRLIDILDRPVIITMMSAGEMGDAIQKIKNFSYPDVSSLDSYLSNVF